MTTKKATRWQVVATAASHLGYVEGGGPDGKSGNITKYWAEHYPAWQGQPWCGAFVHEVLHARGVAGNPSGVTRIFYTPAIVADAKARGWWRTSTYEAQPGDLVLFNFGSGGAKHVGIVEKNLAGSLVQTIEGNTSSSVYGSQNDGGGVYRRVRGRGTILGYVDMSAVLAKNAAEMGVAAPTGRDWRRVRLAEHGKLTTGTIRRLQAEVGVEVDGIAGPITKKAVQRWLGVTADGVWGPRTYSAMQRKVGASRTTGRLTPWLVTALQRWLNENRPAR